MHCRTVQKHLVAYTEAELTEPLRLAVDNHLSACGHCRHALLVLEASRPGPGTPQDHPPEFWAPMHEAVLKELETKPQPTSKFGWHFIYAGSLILAIFWLLQSPTSHVPATIGEGMSAHTPAFSLPP